MKRISLFLALIFAMSAVDAQDKTIMNYNGHWYVPGDNSLDKEALQYQQLLKEKRAFDTLAKNKDVFVTREQFAQTISAMDKLVKDEAVTANTAANAAELKAFYDLIKYMKITLQGNDEYRKAANTASQRVLMVRREGWSDDLYNYILREAKTGLLKMMDGRAGTDPALAMALNELKRDERYQNCAYGIAVDNRMMDDPEMQMFICDRTDYILGADIYRYRESTPGVVTNYAKRKKESADLMGWLLQRATIDKSKFITMVDYNHNPGTKPNEATVSLLKNTDWYIFLFYKGVLYYSDALPKCENGTSVSILYKP